MSETQRDQWTVVAHLLRPQGRKGELLAELLTDFPDRFARQPDVFLAPPAFSGAPSELRAAAVIGSWLPVGKNQGRVVVALAGVESISQAEALAGLDVLIPSSERTLLEPGAEYIDDLVDCILFDGDNEIGSVDAVEFSTGADGRRLPDVAPLLTVVTNDGEEILIPFAEAFVVRIDTAARRIVLSLPPGLLDLNRPGSSV